MSSWIQKILSTEKKTAVPAGVWVKCTSCGETLYSKDLETNNKVCNNCGYHFRLNTKERVRLLLEEGYKELFTNITTADPLKFQDTKKYKDRIKQTVAKAGVNESISVFSGLLQQHFVCLTVFNFSFMGGSMGSVAGEKITRAIEYSLEHKYPFILVSASGGARMQEGTLSLMQMAKTSAALAKLAKAKLPFISVLTDPTTGGVSASVAMLGDLIIAEPKALIGFAGPRVIQQTIGQALPEGFQRSEFLQEKGAIDAVIERNRLKSEIGLYLDYLFPATQVKLPLKAKA